MNFIGSKLGDSPVTWFKILCGSHHEWSIFHRLRHTFHCVIFHTLFYVLTHEPTFQHCSQGWTFLNRHCDIMRMTGTSFCCVILARRHLAQLCYLLMNIIIAPPPHDIHPEACKELTRNILKCLTIMVVVKDIHRDNLTLIWKPMDLVASLRTGSYVAFNHA